LWEIAAAAFESDSLGKRRYGQTNKNRCREAKNMVAHELREEKRLRKSNIDV
jgi:hypothetical protein